jgi:uncharacterized membrane protein
MLLMILGLAVFLAAHTFATFRAERAAVIGRIGETPYKIVFSLVSLAGIALIAQGFGAYRAAGYIPLWDPPAALRHTALLLMLPSFILLAAAYAPAGLIRGAARHPMLAGVKIWAFAHLLANGDLGSVVLFGAFLAWAVYDRIAIRRRADAAAPAPSAWSRGDWIACGVGAAAWTAFVAGLHRLLFGVGVIG